MLGLLSMRSLRVTSFPLLTAATACAISPQQFDPAAGAAAPSEADHVLLPLWSASRRRCYCRDRGWQCALSAHGDGRGRFRADSVRGFLGTLRRLLDRW